MHKAKAVLLWVSIIYALVFMGWGLRGMVVGCGFFNSIGKC